jgi:hypothetical protein
MVSKTSMRPSVCSAVAMKFRSVIGFAMYFPSPAATAKPPLHFSVISVSSAQSLSIGAGGSMPYRRIPASISAITVSITATRA